MSVSVCQGGGRSDGRSRIVGKRRERRRAAAIVGPKAPSFEAGANLSHFFLIGSRVVKATRNKTTVKTGCRFSAIS